MEPRTRPAIEDGPLSSAAPPMTHDRAAAMPPVLGRLMRGTFFLALKTPLQAVIALVSIPLVQRYIGEDLNGAYVFAWSFGFFQFLLEFGMSSALQREVSHTWTRGDRAGVDRAIACGMNFYAAIALVQVAALLGVAYFVLPESKFRGRPAELELVRKLLWLQAMTAPFYGLSAVVSSVLQAASRYDFFPRLELLVVVLRFALLALGYCGRDRLLPDRRGADGPPDRPAARPRALGDGPRAGLRPAVRPGRLVRLRAAAAHRRLDVPDPAQRRPGRQARRPDPRLRPARRRARRSPSTRT